ncbi:hypothetical protein [Pannonibacter sp. SL95]|uniref:hypothetical protein n=1 Tax=Pannonibacter sp. SL95 TaxID=2995153 RepID=UPI00227635F4|nr:hypothetical protein [Pannonibacter sp. SL95]MCY1708159.1 hypothetical protein [Pannonibacter sp. SL95]
MTAAAELHAFARVTQVARIVTKVQVCSSTSVFSPALLRDKVYLSSSLTDGEGISVLFQYFALQTNTPSGLRPYGRRIRSAPDLVFNAPNTGFSFMSSATEKKPAPTPNLAQHYKPVAIQAVSAAMCVKGAGTAKR